MNNNMTTYKIIRIDSNQTNECFDVEIAWNSGDRDLKSAFSENFPLVYLKLPCPFVYK